MRIRIFDLALSVGVFSACKVQNRREEVMNEGNERRMLTEKFDWTLQIVETMAAVTKPTKAGLEETQQVAHHKIRITLSSRNVKNLEKGTRARN